MSFTRNQALDALKTWNPAPVFLDSYVVKWLPENLNNFFGPPEELFLDPDEQYPYTKGRLVPILGDGNFGIITLHDPKRRILVQLDIETPEEIQCTFHNWQQYLAKVLLEIGESIDDDSRVRRMAELMSFQHTDQLFELWRLVGDLPSADYQKSCDDFIARLIA